MAPCLYPFGKPARASATRAQPEVADPPDAFRGGRVSPPSAPGKHEAGPSSASTLASSASPPPPFAHLADVWDVDTLRVGPRAEAPEGARGRRRKVADGPREAESAVVAAAEALRARLLANGARPRGDLLPEGTGSSRARGQSARAPRVRARPALARRRDVSRSSSVGEGDAAAAARGGREAARRDARAFGRSTGATARRRISTPWVWL